MRHDTFSLSGPFFIFFCYFDVTVKRGVFFYAFAGLLGKAGSFLLFFFFFFFFFFCFLFLFFGGGGGGKDVLRRNSEKFKACLY